AVATTLGAAPPAGERPAPRARRGAVLAQPERPRAARAAGDRAAPGARDDGDVAAPGHLDEHGTARKSVEHRTVRGGGDARVGARSFARELLARECAYAGSSLADRRARRGDRVRPARPDQTLGCGRAGERADQERRPRLLGADREHLAHVRVRGAPLRVPRVAVLPA